MDIGNAVNVLISLIFVFLLLSLIASVFAEFVAGAWNSRGQQLRQTVGQLLGDPKLERLAGELYRHPLIAGLTRPGLDMTSLSWLAPMLPILRARQPSYLPPQVVADALTDILRQADAFRTGNIDGGLGAVWRTSGGDLAVFRTKFITWFDEGTARESGAYKRRTQRWLLIYGLVLAVGLNVDTLSIARHLWENRASQEVAEIAAKAQARVVADSEVPSEEKASRDAFNELLVELKDLKLPIGWSSADGCMIARASIPLILRLPGIGWLFEVFCRPAVAVGATAPEVAVSADGKPVSPARWLGWLMTALAVSVGAQFWFDMLGKVVGLRATGRRPDLGSTSGAGTPPGGAPSGTNAGGGTDSQTVPARV